MHLFSRYAIENLSFDKITKEEKGRKKLRRKWLILFSLMCLQSIEIFTIFFISLSFKDHLRSLLPFLLKNWQLLAYCCCSIKQMDNCFWLIAYRIAAAAYGSKILREKIKFENIIKQCTVAGRFGIKGYMVRLIFLIELNFVNFKVWFFFSKIKNLIELKHQKIKSFLNFFQVFSHNHTQVSSSIFSYFTILFKNIRIYSPPSYYHSNLPKIILRHSRGLNQ